MSPPPEPAPSRTPRLSETLTGVLAAAVVAVLSALALLQAPPPGRNTGGSRQESSRPALLSPCLMDRPGFLTGPVYGDITANIDGHGAELGCDGMRRPGEHGLRLFFSAHPPGGGGLVLVLGIDADLATLTGAEHGTGVTLIDETGSRFYHAGADRCWTQVSEVAPLPAEASFRINGRLYCAGALPAVSDSGSVTLGDIAFSGRLHDATP